MGEVTLLLLQWIWTEGAEAERCQTGRHSITLSLCEQMGVLLFNLSRGSHSAGLRRRESAESVSGMKGTTVLC